VQKKQKKKSWESKQQKSGYVSKGLTTSDCRSAKKYMCGNVQPDSSSDIIIGMINSNADLFMLFFYLNKLVMDIMRG